MRPVYLNHCEKGDVLTAAQCNAVFENISIDADDLNRDEYVPGSSGVSRLYRDLIEKFGLTPNGETALIYF
ncbi:hypothetical protein [uncultured Erythrobacter sp.]|uniref:hypothetical protein n=1 Tax=uncultured Erythrobacter sp. TaxID=263913 RepID=UPI00261340A9|nr:hypothetical protein [uncultured Erythrobacter sp.]